MSRNRRSTLSFVDAPAGPTFTHAQQRLVAVREERGLDLARMEHKLTVQSAGLAARREKDRVAQIVHRDTVTHTRDAFRHVAAGVEQANKDAKGMHYEPEIKAFNEHLLQLASNHTLGIYNISAHGIGQIVAMSVIPEPTAEKKGFWARVLGK